MALLDRGKKIRYLDFSPVTVRTLRELFATFGRGSWMVTLVAVDGGYRFHVHPNQDYSIKDSRVICSEKSKDIRIFKTVESALHVARKFGFEIVGIEL